MRPCSADLPSSYSEAILLNVNGLEWLEGDGSVFHNRSTVIYCNPPYVASACASRLRYEHVLTDAQHERLLCRCKQLRCHVLISGYWSELYADHLAGWRVVSWPQMTRGGTWAQEFLWCNFPEPVELHDYQHLGLNFRERQDVKRQQQRWRTKLAAMTILKRQALMSVLAEVAPGPIGGSADPGSRKSRSTNGKAAAGADGSGPVCRLGKAAVEVLEPRHKRR